MSGRDIFTQPVFERPPELGDFIERLHPTAVQALFSTTDLAAAVAQANALPEAARYALEDKLKLLLDSEGLDRNYVEQQLTLNGLTPDANEHIHLLVNALVDKLGAVDVHAAFADRLEAARIKGAGTFADFPAPRIAKIEDFATEAQRIALEKEVEIELSKHVTSRKAKIKFKLDDNRLYIGMYFDRPPAAGRSIDGNKLVVPKSLERGAGDTWGYLRNAQGSRSLLTLRSPGTRESVALRRAIGQAFWKNPGRVSKEATDRHDLDIFMKKGFAAKVDPKYQKLISEVIVGQICVKASSGSRVVVRGSGRTSCALPDFREIRDESSVFGKDAEVEEVELRFLPPSGRGYAKVKLNTQSITIDDTNYQLVHAHLKTWGVVS